jgi:DNA-binding transcriptional ArsR family regulator
MDHDDILTFRAPAREPGRVEATASPVLELAYASFFVTKRGVPPGRARRRPPWLRRFSVEAPEPLRAVADFWRQRGHDEARASRRSCWRRASATCATRPERFLRDLGRLPERYLARAGGPDSATLKEEAERIASRAGAAARPRDGRGVGAGPPRFWRLLGPYWERERRPAVEAAAAAFLAQLARAASVLNASAAPLRPVRGGGRPDPQGREGGAGAGRADGPGGGGRLPVRRRRHRVHRLRPAGERVHERTAQRVAELAPRMKAFADPTRAMLLAVIGRFEGLQFTVGDLAQQLGVSQPTVSGHLRLLREAGLVHIERRGNKAYHRLDREALHGCWPGSRPPWSRARTPRTDHRHSPMGG